MKKYTIEYSFFCVAFIDILGQTEEFKVDGEYVDTTDLYSSDPQKLLEVVASAHSETYETIHILRECFRSFFNDFKPNVLEMLKVCPEDFQNMFLDLHSADISLTNFSDCIIASCPIDEDSYYSRVISRIHLILLSIGALLLNSISAMKKVFRAGIDIGVGTKLKSQEVYGPVFFRAYHYESKIAEYPRIVIGNELMTLLYELQSGMPQFENQGSNDIKYCKHLANKCLELIYSDTDSVKCLDFLNIAFLNIWKSSFTKSEYDKFILNAKEFVDSEYNRFLKSGDKKLTVRYLKLKDYFDKKLVL